MKPCPLPFLAAVLALGAARGEQPAAPRHAPDDAAAGLKSAYWPDRFRAAEALGELGTYAAAAVPALTAALRDPKGYVRMAAADALGKVGPAAAPAAAA